MLLCLFVHYLCNLCNLRMNTNLPIGIFDSGVGGLTVYRALHEHLPNERFVYLGDTARVPYGTKSLATVERYAVENARFLAAHGIKMLVVACNTASALALPAIRSALKIDVVGVIGPGARAAVLSESIREMQTGGAQQRAIGVIATESTVQSGAYTASDCKNRSDNQRAGTCLSVVRAAWRKKVGPTMRSRAASRKLILKTFAGGIDTLVLGCTHYPILRDVIQETVGEYVKLVDSGEATAAGS